MLNQVQITFITPNTQEELRQYRKEFELFYHFFPYDLSLPEFFDVVESACPHTTLVYANSIPIGCFILDIYKRSVELHGICRPDIYDLVPQANRVKLHIYRIILDEVFTGLDKQRVIIKAEPDNKGVRGFAIMWGFTKLQNMDKGRCVWKLEKEAYRKRIEGNGEKKGSSTTTSGPTESRVPV